VPPGVTEYDDANTNPPAPPPAPPSVPPFPPPPPPPPATTNNSTAVTPLGTENVPEPDVYVVIAGALTVILNDLEVLWPVVAAVTVNVDVVFVPTADAVPVIAAVDEFKDNPAGKEPDEIEYVIVSPSGSVAAADDSV
jgi:hypothetical protein